MSEKSYLVGELFADWPTVLHAVALMDLNWVIPINARLKAQILMASCQEHVGILRVLYPSYTFDRELEIAFRALSQVGLIIPLLDTEDDHNHNLIKASYHAAQLATNTPR